MRPIQAALLLALALPALGCGEAEDFPPASDSGELPGGGKFNGPVELAAYLRANMQEEFVHCMAEKMLTYALGRGLEFYDQCAVDKIVEELRQNEFRFSALILGIVQSDPFQKQGAKRSNE